MSLPSASFVLLLLGSALTVVACGDSTFRVSPLPAGGELVERIDLPYDVVTIYLEEIERRPELRGAPIARYETENGPLFVIADPQGRVPLISFSKDCDAVSSIRGLRGWKLVCHGEN